MSQGTIPHIETEDEAGGVGGVNVNTNRKDDLNAGGNYNNAGTRSGKSSGMDLTQ